MGWSRPREMQSLENRTPCIGRNSAHHYFDNWDPIRFFRIEINPTHSLSAKHESRSFEISSGNYRGSDWQPKRFLHLQRQVPIQGRG